MGSNHFGVAQVVRTIRLNHSVEGRLSHAVKRWTYEGAPASGGSGAEIQFGLSSTSGHPRLVPAGLQKLIRNKTHSATGLDFGLRFQHSGAFLHITLVDVLVECSRA
jgi:hypothetical protein